jgi:hypothetical protein
LSPIEDKNLLLRRFNPSNPDHYSVDEATQELRLRSASLRFDPYDNIRGCSVYCDEYLAANRLARSDILEEASWRIVGATAAGIRTLETGLLDAILDPWPDGPNGSRPVDVAHSLITAPLSVGRNAMGKLAKKLARDVFREVAA